MDVSTKIEQHCFKSDRVLGGLTGFKLRTGDEETWNIIAYEYDRHIRPTLIELKSKNLIQPGNIIQAGGNCGVYPMCLTEFFPMVFTFEPDPINFHCLVNNCQNSNIIKFNVALGAHPDKIRLMISSTKNYGMIQTVPAGDEKFFIPQITLDGLQLPDISMIMLDVEGAELGALQGATETIAKYHPVIQVESTNEEITKLLKNYGYEIYKQVENTLDTIYI